MNQNHPIFFLVFLLSLGDFFTNRTHGFFFSFLLGLKDFFYQSNDLKCLHACQSLRLKKKVIIIL